MKLIAFIALCVVFLAPLYGHDYLIFSPKMISTHLENYSDEERELIEEDLRVVRSICFPTLDGISPIPNPPVYLATAGAPGSRKSTILERFFRDHSEFSQGVYLDPDERGLKFMSHTYYSCSFNAYTLGSGDNFADIQKRAYEKWRPASNYIAITLLEEAFSQRRNVIHGTTSTGAITPTLHEAIKKAGYKIVLLLCSCEDDLRREAISYRNEVQHFYHSTPEDALTKGKLFPLQTSTYFSYADELYLYWSDSLFTPERLAGIFRGGEWHLNDADALAHFMDKYERDRVNLKNEGKDIPHWDQLVALYRARFK